MTGSRSRAIEALPPALSVCRADARRAFLKMFAAAVSGVVHPDFDTDVRADILPAALAEANRFAVLPVLASMSRCERLRSHFAAEFLQALDAVREENRARNARISVQLSHIGQVLAAANLSAVALKGAAELLRPVLRDPGERVLSDIDLLVPADRLENAAAILEKAGYRPGQDAANPVWIGHHHLPPLWHDREPLPIELHHRFGSGLIDQLVPGSGLVERAIATAVPGLLVPRLDDHLAVLVAHSGLRVGSAGMTPRDLHGFFALGVTGSEEARNAARRRFRHRRARRAWLRLEGLSTLLLAPDRAPDLDPAASRMATASLFFYGRPRLDRARSSLKRKLDLLHAAATDPDARRRYWAQLTVRLGQGSP